MWRLLVCLVFAVNGVAHDWLIVPGERVGPITAATTEASLRASFGDSAVSPGPVRIDSKTALPGIEIYQDRPSESLAVIWPRHESGLSWPLQVIPCFRSNGRECRWRTPAGIGISSSVAELERLNGSAFSLFPLSHEGTWTNIWWNGGKLARGIGEDIELFFDSPQSQANATECYVQTSDSRLAGLFVSRMFVFLLSRKRTAPVNDWTIVPGVRAGPIPLTARLEALRETLGPDVVHRVLTSADEGIGEIPGIEIFGGDVRRKVLLRRDGNVVCGGENYSSCAWRIQDGLPLKTTVENLNRLNGRSFVFNGCCFDLGGIVTSWEGGRLARYNHLRIAVTCDREQPERMVGEVSLRSNDPELRALKCSASLIDF